MSFILDALKKSEIERQRQSVPGLVDSGIARPSRRLSVWLIALCVLLGANLLALLFVLVRSSLSPPRTEAAPAKTARTAVQSPAAPPGGAAAPAPANDHFSPLDAPPVVYAPEIPVSDSAATAHAPPMTRTQQLDSSAAPARAANRRDPVLNDDSRSDDAEILPSINEINLTGAQALPELHLDVHVFATQAPERFVYINMRKYHEGATLQEGPTVERIRRDGVILAYQGLRFLLPRQ